MSEMSPRVWEQTFKLKLTCFGQEFDTWKVGEICQAQGEMIKGD